MTIARKLLDKFEAVGINKTTKFRVTKALTGVAKRAGWGERLGLKSIKGTNYELTVFQKMMLLIEWTGKSGTIIGSLKVNSDSLPHGKSLGFTDGVASYKKKNFSPVTSTNLKNLAEELGLEVSKDSVIDTPSEPELVDPPIKKYTEVKVPPTPATQVGEVKSGPSALVDDLRTDGKKRVYVGDAIRFSSDLEQTGRITAITKSRLGDGHLITIESLHPGGFEGDYISGNTTTQQRSEDCWVE